MYNPKVSVIITCYNYGQYVEDAINSVLAQTYSDYELICVNDGSTDNTTKILKAYEDFATFVNFPVCSGSPVAPRNSGAAASIGDLLLFLDADDTLDPHYLEITVPLMTRNVGVVATWMQMFEGSNERVGSQTSSYPIFSPEKEDILNGNSLPICSLIRKETFNSVWGFDPRAPLGSEDWALWAAIVCKTNWKIVVTPEYLFNYRVHPNSLSRRMPPFAQTQKWMGERFSA